MALARVGPFGIEYRWFGPPPEWRPTIVFLHEGLGCVEMWHDFPERVAEVTGCGALVYSRAGYGKSNPITLPRSINFMHEEALKVLPEILQIFNIREMILFGHSDGGSIALIHAGTGDPNVVRGLVLEAPHVFVEDLSIASITEAKDQYENGSLKSSLERYHGRNVDCAFRGWNEVWLNPEFRFWNIESYLPNINVPVLLVQGENDQYGTSKQLEAIRVGCRAPVQTSLLPECGHSPHREQPEIVLDIASSFINRVIDNDRGVL